MKLKKLLLLLGTPLLLASCSISFNFSSNSSDVQESSEEIISQEVSSSESVQQESKKDDSTPETKELNLTKDAGYKVRFSNVRAQYYLVIDDNDYRGDIRIEGDSTSDYFYYEPEVVGKHNITVVAYNANNGIIDSDTIESTEVEPVFSYNPFSAYYTATASNYWRRDIPDALWDLAERAYGHQSTHYFFLNDNLEWTIKGTLAAEKYDKKMEEADFSLSPMVDKIMLNLKEAGNNVILLSNKYSFCETYLNWSWWYESDKENCLIRYMDAAWKYGIKCIITDAAIFSACNLGTEVFTGNKETLKQEVQDKVRSRLLHSNKGESNLQLFLKHKAFYGFNMPDEPYNQSQTYYAICYTNQLIDELYETNQTLKRLTKPLVFTSLHPFATWLHGDKATYKKYIQNYIDIGGFEQVGFDLYTYTTMSYGNNSFNEYYCNVKVAFEVFSEVMLEKPGVKIYQTINSGNDPGRNPMEGADVYASHLLAAAAQFYGYGLFVFSPFDNASVWENEAVTYKQERTANYRILQEANGQFVFIKGLLDGYVMTSMEIQQKPQSGYGYGLKMMKVTYANGDKTATMYVNYETDIKKTGDVSFTAEVPQGHRYYLFGENKLNEANVNSSASTSITLNKAEALLVL